MCMSHGKVLAGIGRHRFEIVSLGTGANQEDEEEFRSSAMRILNTTQVNVYRNAIKSPLFAI